MRIRIDSRSTDLIDSLTRLYDFKLDGIITRIAFAYSLQLNKRFDLDQEFTLGADGRDWRDERTLFGVSADEKPYFTVYKAMIDQHFRQRIRHPELPCRRGSDMFGRQPVRAR